MTQEKSAGEGVTGGGFLDRWTLRMTQIFGFCFYWAWVYLSFNASSSVNYDLANDMSGFWVHQVSTITGVITYALIIAFSVKAQRLFQDRKYLRLAGLVLALGTACYALIPAPSAALLVAGGMLTGISSCWVVVFWGEMFSKMDARDIIVATAASFLAANLIYFGAISAPTVVRGIIMVALPLCAVFLIPGEDRVPGVGSATLVVPAAEGGDEDAKPARMLVSVGKLPIRLATALFIIMFVYGGARIFIGHTEAVNAANPFATLLAVVLTCLVFVVWGLLYKGAAVSLSTVFKLLMPLLAMALLLITAFGEEYSHAFGPIITIVNLVLEMLTWILLADIARTSRVPVFLVFALGRMAVQGGMVCGQMVGFYSFDQAVPFVVVSVYALMMVMGFMFDDQDAVLVFDAPTEEEVQALEEKSGRSFDDHLSDLAAQRGLTQREAEIFLLWATGHGSKYIQESLVISAATVKTHVRHIYDKFGVHSRAEMIKLLEGEGE